MNIARIIQHRLLDERDVKRALGKGGMVHLEEMVRASEMEHTGQIRLCIEAGLPLGELLHGTHARARALQLFGHLRVWDTERNNGVLIYLLMAERKIEIVADRGISHLVPDGAWQQVLSTMAAHLQAGQWIAALDAAIDGVTPLLQQHFPREEGQAEPDNELPDSPVIL